MHTFVINLLISLATILTFVEVRPLSKLEQNLMRQRRQNQANLLPYPPTSTIKNHEMIDDLWNVIHPILNDHMNSHLTVSSKVGCQRTTTSQDNSDYIEHCLEKILNPDGQSYSTKTSAILYKTDGTIIPLHQAESSIEIATYNHHN